MKKSLGFLFALLMAFPLSSHAGRILFAAQFSLVPEVEAHRTFGTSSDKALDPDSIKILVWNLKKGQQAGLDKDLPAYGKDRDLLVLSEGYMSPAVRGIFESFSESRFDLGVAFLYKKDHDYATGTLIGSRVAPSWSKVKQTVDLEPFILTPKCMTFAKYPIKGQTKELLVISIHAINAVTPAALDRQLAQAAEEIKRHDGPVIFGGDFNTNMSTKVTRLKNLAKGLGLTNMTFRNDDRKIVFGQVIDYIFTRGLRTKDSEVLGKLVSSDHKAMLAELSVGE